MFNGFRNLGEICCCYLFKYFSILSRQRAGCSHRNEIKSESLTQNEREGIGEVGMDQFMQVLVG